MKVRVEEGGKSEGRAVMARIGIEEAPGGVTNIIPGETRADFR